MRIKLISIMFLLFFVTLKAQIVRDGSEANTQEEFVEDYNNGEARLALKTDVFTAIIGQIPLLAEVRLNRNVTVELGVYYVYNEVFMPMGENSSLKDDYNINPTIGASLEGRYYFEKAFGTNSSFIGFRYKYKKIEREESNPDSGSDPRIIGEKYNAILFMWGKQFTFNERFLFEYTFGIGYNHAVYLRYKPNQTTGEYEPVEYNPNFFDDSHVPLILQVGLRFGVFAF